MGPPICAAGWENGPGRLPLHDTTCGKWLRRISTRLKPGRLEHSSSSGLRAVEYRSHTTARPGRRRLRRTRQLWRLDQVLRFLNHEIKDG
jgi:hypothetical protein